MSYLTDRVGYAALIENFPHTPEDAEASFRDYLNDRESNGWALVSHAWYSTSFAHCIFRQTESP